MPINKYHSRDLNKMRDTINIDSAMFTPKLDDIFGLDRLVKGDMLQCSYGIASFPEMRSMHSTLAMTMALDSIKRYHNDTHIFHMPHEPITFDHYNMYENHSHIPVIDLNISAVPKRTIDNFKERPYLYIDSFIDNDIWCTPVSRYDEEKVKAYKIPSKDRLDMLVRVNKFIIGNK